MQSKASFLSDKELAVESAARQIDSLSRALTERIASKYRARQIPSARKRSASMESFRKPMTTEELRQMAAEKFEEAATLPPGPDQQKVFISAAGFQHAADVRCWLASELRPPK